MYYVANVYYLAFVFSPKYNFLITFQYRADEVCDISTSRDITQPLFHAETLNVKVYMLTANISKIKKSFLPNSSFIFDILSENVITLVRM